MFTGHELLINWGVQLMVRAIPQYTSSALYLGVCFCVCVGGPNSLSSYNLQFKAYIRRLCFGGYVYAN